MNYFRLIILSRLITAQHSMWLECRILLIQQVVQRHVFRWRWRHIEFRSYAFYAFGFNYLFFIISITLKYFPCNNVQLTSFVPIVGPFFWVTIRQFMIYSLLEDFFMQNFNGRTAWKKLSNWGGPDFITSCHSSSFWFDIKKAFLNGRMSNKLAKSVIKFCVLLIHWGKKLAAYKFC